MSRLAIAGILALISSFALTPVVIAAARRFSILDAPEERKIHSLALPRAGGLAFAVAWLGSTAYLFLPALASSVAARGAAALLVGGALITAVGLLDDVKSIAPLVKLTLVGAAGGVFLATAAPALNFNFALAIAAVIWIAALTNAFNLIDGLDGLAAGLAAIAAAGLAALSVLARQPAVLGPALTLTAVCLGFLPFNRRPAKIFMGDLGSLFLGFILSVLVLMAALEARTPAAFVAPFFFVLVPIYDTVLTIVRRIINKEPLFMPDKRHFYNLLMERGFSHSGSVNFCYALALALGAAGLALGLYRPSPAATGAVVLVTLVLLGELTRRYRLLE